jgi:CHAD domain-containing protein
MPSSAVETETTHDLDAGAAFPDLDELPGVARVPRPERQELDAVYFDTADLRLARARVTLRRRTGGSDEGWHVKLPLGGDDREEVRAPLGRAVRSVPVRLARLVRVHTRDADLVPVARISTRRTVRRLVGADGQVLAEVADDHVDAEKLLAGADGDPDRPVAWREVEVELVEGDRDLLAAAGKVLVAAGAEPAAGRSKLAYVLQVSAADGAAGRSPGPRTPAGDVVLAHLREQVGQIVWWDPQVRRDVEDSVHKMRVATRRLRSALATYRPLLDRDVTEPLRDELKWLGGVLGEARDAEVLLARLLGALDAEPREAVVGPVRRRVGTELRGRYRSAHAEVVAALDGDRYLALLASLDALLEDPWLAGNARLDAATVLPARVRKAWKRVRSRVQEAEAAATTAERDTALHEARKAAKRARYAGESVAPALGAPAARFASAMEDVQEVLGEHQDGVVTRRLLLGLAATAQDAGESTFTYGRLHAREEARAQDGLRAFDDLWPSASRAKLRRWLR